MLRACRLVIALVIGSQFSGHALSSPASELAIRVQAPLHAIYETRQFEPLWLENSKPTARAMAAIQLLEQSGEDGLQPHDYGITSLQQQATALQQHSSDDAALAAFDLALSQALSRYASDMTIGRVAPRALGLDIDITANQTRLPQRLHALLLAEDINTVAISLRPAVPPYAALRELLARQRVLAAQHPQPPGLPPLPGKKLEAGQAWDGLVKLADTLVLLGDLPGYAPDVLRLPGQYNEELVAGVKHFQSRHGLTTDGVIGKQTYDALQVPLAQRVQQIELAMERLRWIDSNITGQRFLLINIPQFTLWAYGQGAVPALQMPVVVGIARKHETPVMAKTLSSLVFSPYWNVPRSIAMKELLPKLRKDPSYLVHEDMELIDKNGVSHGSAFGRDQENGVILGDYRIRQRAGEKNALGKLKFVFPNNDSIYMHDTPSKRLFAKDRRDFSHGCVRVGDPMALALFALETQGEWNEETVNAKIAASTDQHLALKERMPVLLTYFTANVDAEGRALFFQDIYGQDEKLAAALKRRVQ